MNGEVIKLDDAWQRLQAGTAVYLDVRATSEFASGHPTGAYHIPLIEAGPAGRGMNEEFAAAVKALVADLGGDEGPELIVACHAGGRSRQACQLLAAEGVTRIVDFSGGWGGRAHPLGGEGLAGWADSDKPQSTTAEAGRDWPTLQSKIGG